MQRNLSGYDLPPIDRLRETLATDITQAPGTRKSRNIAANPYSAPSAGPPPWHVYRVTPATVFAFGTSEPGGATRFELS